MEKDGKTIPEIFLEYINYIDPYFRSEFEGVGVIDAGAYDYAMIYCTEDGDKLRLKVEKIAREYREAHRPDEEKSCSNNVVAVHFGSNKNAPEKG